MDLLEEEESVIWILYYLENFRIIISVVFLYEDNVKLFSVDDKWFINVFGEFLGKLIFYRYYGYVYVYVCIYEIKLKV